MWQMMRPSLFASREVYRLESPVTGSCSEILFHVDQTIAQARHSLAGRTYLSCLSTRKIDAPEI